MFLSAKNLLTFKLIYPENFNVKSWNFGYNLNIVGFLIHYN